MKNLRRIFQLFFFSVFITLLILTDYRGKDILEYPVKLFLDFDPLILISTVLTTHSVIKALLVSLSVVALTLFLGRVFCGWICPFGALHNVLSFAKRKKNLKNADGAWNASQNIKYYVLFFLLVGSLFSFQYAGILDPLSLLVRSLALSVFPAISFITERIFQVNFLSFKQPYFQGAALFGILFFAVTLINLKKRRFWCKYVCPLGALLGLLSYTGMLRLKVNDSCNGCKKCLKVCPAGCNPDSSDNWKKQECFACYNCVEECPETALSFAFGSKRKPSQEIDLSRRHFINSLLAGVLVFPVLKVNLSAKLRQPKLIRPPGAKDEEEFLSRCIRCGECMKTCPTGGLQPTLSEGGLEGIWTPMLVPRVGYCEFNCTLCTQVCPTRAIERLGLQEKQKVKLGLAFIDRDRCLPYAFGIDCIVCEEHCPVAPKAIWLQEPVITRRDGAQRRIKQPVVSPELCIGCGICEYKCPVRDKPAIYVTSVNETRAKARRLTL